MEANHFFQRFQQINPNIPKEMPYQSAKALSTMYNHSKQLLYEQVYFILQND